jgi:hypothetical protein
VRTEGAASVSFSLRHSASFACHLTSLASLSFFAPSLYLL